MSKENSNTPKEASDKLTDKGQAALKRIGKKKRKKIIKTIIVTIIIIVAAFWLLINSGMAKKIIETMGLEDSVKKAGLGTFFKLEEEMAESALTTYTVGTRTITQILSSTGTIEPNDQYSINGLVSGEILEDFFNEGDTVIEDQVLYRIDSDNLNSGVTRAENALKNANTALDNALERLEKLSVESDYTGTVKKMYVEEGDEIAAGTRIADIVDDAVMCIDIPFMEVDIPSISVGDSATITFSNYEETHGTVSEISAVTNVNNLGVTVRNVTIKVNNTGSITTTTRAYAQIGEAYCTADSVFYYNDEGQIFSEIAGEVDKIYFDEGTSISKNDIIIKLTSDDLEEQIEDLEDNVEEAEDSLQDARDAFDDYNIKAPITGKVISKSYKTGDTLSSGGMNSSSTLAVIYDMSALKFTMSIDELDIDKLEEGQDVIITCDSRVGKEYHGTVTNISIQGTTNSGTTVYPVEVTIENVEDTEKRVVLEDGTISKTYKTGMTSTEKTYSLVSASSVEGGTEYKYSDDVIITQTADGLYHGDRELNEYLSGTYTQGAYFYDFSSDFSSLTLEIQNDKQMLRPGMNIDAEIIVEQRENVIAVPLDAVGRGNVVKVIKSSAKTETDSSNEKNADEKQQDLQSNNDKAPTHDIQSMASAYGTADKDTPYEEVRVSVGISDDDFAEITSGLNIGDVIIVEAQTQSSDQMFPFAMMGGGMSMGGMSGMGGGMPPSGMNGGMRGGMGR